MKTYAAELRTSMGMHNGQQYGKSIMTSYGISERDKTAKIINYSIYMQNSFCTCV